MNKKITFPELIDLVSQSNGTTKKTSESFVKEFFAAIYNPQNEMLSPFETKCMIS